MEWSTKERCNVANGGSLLTTDGLGTFNVNYGVGSNFGSNSIVLSNFQATAIPEPAATLLLGLLGIGMVAGKRRKKLIAAR